MKGILFFMSSYNQRRNYRNNNNFNTNRRRRAAKSQTTYINPARFISPAKPVKEEIFIPENSFQDFDLVSLIKDNLLSMGYQTPSPIQDKTIPLGIKGSDIVGIANTGTGKTAAFAVPVINKLIGDSNSKAIILAPTRELAQQIESQVAQIAKGSGITAALLIGGARMMPQLRELEHKPRIIVGTPGRIKDHIERRTLKLTDCNIVVLDEVDRMLDMGFVDDITSILNLTSPNRQSFYFSATLNDKVKSIINNFSNNPTHISVKSGETSDNIEQNVVLFNSVQEKVDKLHDLLISDNTSKTIVFADTHRSVEKLTKELEGRGFSTDSLHGGKSQSQRERVLKKFKDNYINILVATDVAARGLDVADITHVINYTLPHTYEDYVHRIGRTGRAGKIGYALTFVEKR